MEKKSGTNALSLDNSTNALSVWPNPSHDIIFINIVAGSKSQAAIKVFDNKGALLKHQQTTILQGSNQVSLDMKGLAGRTYHLSAEWNNGQMKKTAQVAKQ
ncbi:MAG: T9SS type A sorting domain-containing protein [Gloeobacteraceae cyanobacterium ES-bin-316]|nr:T9SS type A sorting domain-containing protein [Ferruginibacter sp.]